MVKVCCCCSKVDVEALKEVVSEDQLQVGCIDHCAGFDGKPFGLIDGELVVAEDQADFIDKVKASL